MQEAFLTELKQTKISHTQDPIDLKAYGRDWTKVHEPAPSVVCFNPQMRFQYCYIFVPNIKLR